MATNVEQLLKDKLPWHRQDLINGRASPEVKAQARAIVDAEVERLRALIRATRQGFEGLASGIQASEARAFNTLATGVKLSRKASHSLFARDATYTAGFTWEEERDFRTSLRSQQIDASSVLAEAVPALRQLLEDANKVWHMEI